MMTSNHNTILLVQVSSTSQFYVSYFLVIYSNEAAFHVFDTFPGMADLRPDWVKRYIFDIHFLHFGCILFVIVLIAVVVISLWTDPVPEECVSDDLITFITHTSSELHTLSGSGEQIPACPLRYQKLC